MASDQPVYGGLFAQIELRILIREFRVALPIGLMYMQIHRLLFYLDEHTSLGWGTMDYI